MTLRLEPTTLDFGTRELGTDPSVLTVRIHIDDHYAVLGVAPDAGVKEIKSAYRKLARQHHPDRNPDADDEFFRRIQDAWEVLSDITQRQHYDGATIELHPSGSEWWIVQSSREKHTAETQILEIDFCAIAGSAFSTGPYHQVVSVMFGGAVARLVLKQMLVAVPASPRSARASSGGSGDSRRAGTGVKPPGGVRAPRPPGPGDPPPRTSPTSRTPPPRRRPTRAIPALGWVIAGIVFAVILGVSISALSHGGGAIGLAISRATAEPGVKWAIDGRPYASTQDFVDLSNAHIVGGSAIAQHMWTTPSSFIYISGPHLTALSLADGHVLWKSDGSTADPYPATEPVGSYAGLLWFSNGWSVDLNTGEIFPNPNNALPVSDYLPITGLRRDLLAIEDQSNFNVYQLPYRTKIGSFPPVSPWPTLLSDDRILLSDRIPKYGGNWDWQPVFQADDPSGQKLWRTAMPQPSGVDGQPWQSGMVYIYLVGDNASNVFVDLSYSGTPDHRFLVDLDPRTGAILWQTPITTELAPGGGAFHIRGHDWVLQSTDFPMQLGRRFFTLSDKTGSLTPIRLPKGSTGNHILGVKATNGEEAILLDSSNSRGEDEILKYLPQNDQMTVWNVPGASSTPAPIVEGVAGDQAIVFMPDSTLRSVSW